MIFERHHHSWFAFPILKTCGIHDVDWASCLNDKRSTSGYCMYL